MKTKNQTFTLTTLTAAVMAIFTANAVAEEDTVSELVNPDSNVSIGIGHVSGERAQFGVFDNLRGNDNLLLLDADVNKRDDATGTWTTFSARNLGIDNRSIELDYERQGDWGIGLEYDEITRSAPYTVNTGMTGFGTTRQIVPFSGAGYVPGTGTDVMLKTEREKVGLNAYKHLAPNLRLKVDFKSEDKYGTRHWGRGDEPEFAAEPIDSTIRQLEVSLDYTTKQFQLKGGYNGSQYINDNSLVYTNGDQGTLARTAYLSVPLDNQAHQLFLNGGHNFTPATRGTFRLSFTHATQDEHLPTSDLTAAIANPAYFPPAAGSPTNLNGVLDTTVVFLGLTSRPMNNLSVAANLRYHKVDEKTPAWRVVCSGACDGTTSEVHSTPLDYETLSGKLEGTYRLMNDYSLIAGIDIKNQNRTVPFGNDNDGDGLDNERYVHFRSDLDETTYRIQLRKSMSERLNGSLALLHSKRDGSSYSVAEHSFNVPTDPEPPAMIDPVNISDRDRNKLRATLDWAATERVNLTFNVETTKDDYSGHTFGLRDGSMQLYSVDGDYNVSQDWQLTGWVSYDKTKAHQYNWRDGNGGAGPVYTNFSEAWLYDTLMDTGKSVGLGLKGKVKPTLKVGANLEWTRTNSEYDQDITPVAGSGGPLYYPDTTAPLPDIESTATKLDLFAEYALSKQSDLRLDLIHEIWETNDWTWQFSDGSPFIYTGRTNSDGTMVITDPKQSATFVGARYIYKF